MLTGPALPDPAVRIGRRRLRPKGFSEDSRLLLDRVGGLMVCPFRKYLTVMLSIWLPLLETAGDRHKPFATPATLVELQSMSPATVDRYLAPVRERTQLCGIAATGPPRPFCATRSALPRPETKRPPNRE